MKCSKCGLTENLQTHHISYHPEETQTLCIDCHSKLHKRHGVGTPKGSSHSDQLVAVLEKKSSVITTRLTPRLKEAIDEYLERDAYTSYGDLVRDALRDKLKKDIPEIYEDMLKDKDEAGEAEGESD